MRAQELRHQHFQQLATSYASTDDKAHKSIKKIIKAEELKQLYRKLAYLRRQNNSSKLNRILVPSIPGTDPKNCTSWRVVDDPQEMEVLLL